MCHMFLLNVEFGNSFGFSSVTFRPSRVFHSRVFSRPVLTQTNRVLDVARIFTQHSKCCDECFVLTTSLYAFISLLYKQLLKYTQLKFFTVPSALLTKFYKKFHTKLLASAFIFTKSSTKTLCFDAAMFHLNIEGYRKTRPHRSFCFCKCSSFSVNGITEIKPHNSWCTT